ncbi:hypothetical protein KP509_13G005800 [Ceratopteris richardii]|uniref:Xyloglucan endotransglucosylase/hydrolase n=1 Tax=Ceratopteris richardii TaxID=49495 RepID=A0A8T2TG54_CERRI|nr:hypothetical protein KP509_13G005800 [Ceratopteris richardii]
MLKLLFLSIAILALHPSFSSGEQCKLSAPPPTSPLTGLLPCTLYNNGFANIWASDHQTISDDQNHVTIELDASSGTGFKTKTTYVYGFFNAAIKVPSNDYTAGVINTFYTSNAEIYPNTHDEIDFEFLGRIPGEECILQTNVYANGSTNVGREQRHRLWFDPTKDFHDYSILWTPEHVVWFVDDIPIREFPNLTGQKADAVYPGKQMYLYATIWDGSDWATDGGKYRANFSYAPFVASYSNFIVCGCALPQPSSPLAPVCDREFSNAKLFPSQLSTRHRRNIQWAQANYMTYDYCQDKNRYPTPPPECATSPPKIHEQIDNEQHEIGVDDEL